MIPSHFIIRDSFPLTFHGKIDKKALLLQEAVLDSDQKISPITREEGLLRDIWSDVLLIPAKNININDNFFRLGGHSLLANQVITRIHSLFFVKINVAAIFKAPTIKELAQLISHSVKSEQNYPLLLHVKENNAQYLSSNQLRLWFLSEFNHNSAIYNIFAGWHLQGDLNLHFLNNAIVDIIKQQGAFRTIFLSANGKPKQVLQPDSAVNFNLEVEELYNTSFEQVQDYLKQLAAKPFKLDHEKPFRFKLLKLSENEYVLFICLHHIIADAWSFGILYRDLSLYYQSYFNQVIPVVKMLPAQYIDYCVWQHAIYNTTNDNYKKQINYWKDRLAYIQPLELPVDYVRPIIQTYAGDAVHFKIDPQNIQVLQKISDLNNITLFATVLSIFAIIMMKYSKQQDITIGIPIANRALEAVEHLIGFFVNTVVIRFDFANNPQFLDLLHITMNLILEAHDNSEVLFEKIIDTLHPERDQSRSPIFQVMFSFNNTISGNIEFPNVSVDQIKIASSYAHLDLICFLEEDGEGYIEYNTALFSRNTIQRLVDNYLTVLKNISTVSQQRVNEIFVLSNVERNLLKELGHNKKEFKIKKNLIELFEEQADKYSSKVAIIYGGTQITYFELNQRANQLAYLILNDFPKTNSYIAIYLDRNIDTIIAFLAVLKTGNAYVPIDCNAPRALTESIIIDANIALILTQKKYSQEVSQLELPFNIEFILVDELPNLNPNEKLSNLPSFLSTCEAYVLYTSGTTGKPKGVQITHQSLTNLMFSMKDEVDFSQKDVLLAISPLVFDLSVPDVYLPLTTGATLVLANAATRFNPAEILQLITDFQVTIMQATPTTWQMMMAADWPNDFNIKIICGGEGLNTQLAKELLNRGATVWNFYGPTEATVWSTCCKINSVDDNHPLIPIGRPLANTEIYILDENLQPTPIGVLGELYIGGEGVALGYLNNPEMTSECFISHKIFNSKPRKLFKTGDLALWTHLHELHFLGRKDNQIKMRGHRIEPEAIEKVLQQYPDIYQAIVLDKNPMHEIELTAYIILKTSTIKLNEIRFFLIQHLPSYMIPSKFVVIHNIPLTFTGKVDRKNLPNIQDFYYLRNEPQVNVPLQNKYEKTISDTIKKLLILSNVDLEANFFDLGLHSLHLVEFSYTLNKALDKKIEIMDLFAYPTVRELANYLINSEDKMLQNLETHRAISRKSRRLIRRVTDND